MRKSLFFVGLKKVSSVSRRKKAGERGGSDAAKVMKPLGELNGRMRAGLEWVLLSLGVGSCRGGEPFWWGRGVAAGGRGFDSSV
jgi:hypothetical protein